MIKAYVEWIEAEKYCVKYQAKLDLINPIELNGELTKEIYCSLDVAHTHQVQYNFPNLSNATINEVKSWSFVIWKDLKKANDKSISEIEKLKFTHEIDHNNLWSITFYDQARNIVYCKNNFTSFDVNYKVVNKEFNQEYADEFNDGHEGPGNLKYHEIWKYRIENIKQFSQNKNSELELTAINENNETHIFKIKNMYHVCCELEDGSFEDYYVSNTLIRNIHTTNDKNQNTRFYFYLDSKYPLGIIEDTTYILSSEFPEELKAVNWKTVRLPNKVKSKLIERSGSIARSF